MNDALRIIDLLVNNLDEMVSAPELLERAELERLRDTLLTLTRGNRAEAVEEAEALRQVVRLQRGV